MRKFLSILVAVVMLMSMVPVFGAGTPVAKADTAPLDIVILYPTKDMVVAPKTCFYVNAVISNKGSDPVSTTATLSVQGNAEIQDAIAKPVELGDHGTTDVWWYVCCTDVGDVKLTVTAGAVSKSVTIHQGGAKELTVYWIETPCMDPFFGSVPVGTLFTVKAGLSSNFDSAKNVRITIGYTGNLQLLSSETVPVGDVHPYRDEEAAWNFKCTGSGPASVYIKKVEADNLNSFKVTLPKKCSFYQGEEPGSWGISVDAPSEICTNCFYREFTITAYATNNSGSVANDVYAEIKIYDYTLATLKTGTQKRQFVSNSVPDGSNTPSVTWDIICLKANPPDDLTKFKVTFYKDANGTPSDEEGTEGTAVVSKEIQVDQKNFRVTVEEVGAEPGDVIVPTEGGVYVTEPCNGFYVKTTFKNCTCFPVQSVIATADVLNNALLVDHLDIEEWQVDVTTGVPHQKGEGYTVPASAVTHVGNRYSYEITPVCDCCYYVITWHFKCLGSDACTPNDVIFGAYDKSGNLLDSDSFKLLQVTSPKLSAGVSIFPGWLSDQSLGTTEITGIASACEGGSLGDSSKFSIVIPVANLGDIVAENVYVTAEITGSFYLDRVVDVFGNEISYTFSNNIFSTTISEIGGLCGGGNAYKIIIEGECIGDEDVHVNVTDLGGIDLLTTEPIPAKDKCDEPNTFLPEEKTLKQIPIDFVIVEPEDDSSIPFSSNFAVKIRVHNCSGDEDNIIKGLQATISWGEDEPVEFNPETGETETHSLGDLVPGGYAETSWNMHCNGVGNVTFTVTLTSTDPVMTLAKSVTVYQYPETYLNLTLVSPLSNQCLTFTNGETFPVTVKVENTGDYDAVNVNVEPYIPDYYKDYFEVVESPAHTAFPILGKGEETPLLTWTFKVVKADSFTSVPGTPSQKWIYIYADGDNTYTDRLPLGIYIYPSASLKVEIEPLPDNYAVIGSDFDLKVKVTNTGWADAYQVAVTINLPDNVKLQPGSGSTTIDVGTLQGHGVFGSKEVTFKLQCEGAGKSTITATATGIDEYGYVYTCHSLSSDFLIRFRDDDENGQWDSYWDLNEETEEYVFYQEPVVYDVNGDGKFETYDPIISGPGDVNDTLAVDDPLSYDSYLRFYDANSNGHWDPGERISWYSGYIPVFGLVDHKQITRVEVATYTFEQGTTPLPSNSVTIHLTDGWNVISVPFSVNVSALGSHITEIYYWDGFWEPVTGNLQPGVGYLVNHTGVEDITVSGTPTTSPVTINATGSYMVIGNPFEVPIALSSIGGTAHITEIYYWDGFWEPVTGNLQPGVGYLILTSDVGTLIFQRP